MGIPNIYGGEMKREITVGITLAGVTAALLLALPEPMAKGAVAILLSVIAAIYIGFSLASKGELPVIKQVAGAIGFILLAFLGLWFSWWFLVAGLALHGVWDYLHHGRRGKGVVPRWYVPFCAAYDIALAILVAVFFALRR